MKAVMLDWATMGPGLDLSELRTLLTARQVAVDEFTANVAAFLNGEERCRVV